MVHCRGPKTRISALARGQTWLPVYLSPWRRLLSCDWIQFSIYFTESKSRSPLSGSRSYFIALSTKKILLLLYLFHLFSIKVEMKKKKDWEKRITLTKEMPYGVSKAYLEAGDYSATLHNLRNLVEKFRKSVHRKQ